MRSFLYAGLVTITAQLAAGCASTATGSQSSTPQWQPPAQQAMQPYAPRVSYTSPPGVFPSAPPDPVFYVSPLGAGSVAWHREGDYAVYRFTGRTQASPLTLTEKVVALQGENAVVDLTFSESSGQTAIRLLVGNSAIANHQILRAAILENGYERPVPVELYDALMARTTFAADQNHGLFSQEQITLQTNGDPLTCRRNNYLVTFGQNQGFLSVTESLQNPGTEVAGELKSMDGTVLYRAELAEVGNSLPTSVAVAGR